jgi:hypothetical protein
MLSLTLNAEEHEVLQEILREALSELRMEISDTDSYDFRTALHRREEVIKQLVRRLAVDPDVKSL